MVNKKSFRLGYVNQHIIVANLEALRQFSVQLEQYRADEHR